MGKDGMCTFVSPMVMALLVVGLFSGFVTMRRMNALRAQSGLSREDFAKANAGLFKRGSFGDEGEPARQKLVGTIKLQALTFGLATIGILYIVNFCGA